MTLLALLQIDEEEPTPYQDPCDRALFVAVLERAVNDIDAILKFNRGELTHSIWNQDFVNKLIIDLQEFFFDEYPFECNLLWIQKALNLEDHQVLFLRRFVIESTALNLSQKIIIKYSK